MTEPRDALTVVTKTAIVFDICSSTSMLEDLTLTGSVERWRNLLISLKDFAQNDKSGVELYKFVGDGWILFFGENFEGATVLDFLLRISEFFDSLIHTDVVPHLEKPPERMGLTFGLDRGKLIRVQMNEVFEYIGRPINIAARLQAAAKDSAAKTSYNLLISRPAFTALNVTPAWRAEPDSPSLRNIRGGEKYDCFRIQLLDRYRTETVTATGNTGLAKRTFNRGELEALLADFSSSVKRNGDDKLSIAIRAELLEGKAGALSKDTRARLARWCSTTNPVYRDGSAVARKISMLLFGKILQREEST
jgi:hypothetical protein